jgi:hypothetical protein
VRCPRCGNENQDGNRFCGQCGATLLAVATTPAGHSERTAATSHTAVPERPPAPQRNSEEKPSISGPSFLGLADAPPPRRGRGSLSIDPHSSHSGNLDYLLEDEEEPHGGGAGKFFLILVALLLAVGFGYVRFKTHGFPWASAGTNKPAPTTQPTDSDTASNAPAPSTPSITEEPHPQPAPSQPPASNPAPPASASANAPHDNSAANPPASSPEKSAAPPPASDTAASKPSDSTPNADTKEPDTTDSEKDTTVAEPAEPAPKPKPVGPPAKPHAASKPVDQVAEAQKYLYGKGVPQDCDRGLRILKPLANQADPKAMIELGALYSAGLCTPRDLPTAYRWFAMVLRKDPSNDAVQTDLQKLWGEMTQPERQLAIKLTQ